MKIPSEILLSVFFCKFFKLFIAKNMRIEITRSRFTRKRKEFCAKSWKFVWPAYQISSQVKTQMKNADFGQAGGPQLLTPLGHCTLRPRCHFITDYGHPIRSSFIISQMLWLILADQPNKLFGIFGSTILTNFVTVNPQFIVLALISRTFYKRLCFS